MTEQAYMGVKEAASILGLDEKTVTRHCATGIIPALKIGTRYRIPMSWLNSRSAGPAKITAAELDQAVKPEEKPRDPGVPEAAPAVQETPAVEKNPAAAPVATANKPQGDKMHGKGKPSYDIESKIRKPVKRKPQRPAQPGPGRQPGKPGGPAEGAGSGEGTRTGFLLF